MSRSPAFRMFSTAIRTWLVALVVLGLAYPLAMTAIARATFPEAAGGTLVRDEDGAPVGSLLIGQQFTSDEYFHSRPSAAGDGYDAMASGGTNLGPTSAELARIVADRSAELRRIETGLKSGDIPPDMLSASASGLDPHISPGSALAQAPRVARARGMAPEAVRRLVLSSVIDRDLGFIGEPRLNVLELNMALDASEKQ